MSLDVADLVEPTYSDEVVCQKCGSKTALIHSLLRLGECGTQLLRLKEDAEWMTAVESKVCLSNQLEQAKRRAERAERSLRAAGFEDHGGELWEPPAINQTGRWVRRLFGAEDQSSSKQSESQSTRSIRPKAVTLLNALLIGLVVTIEDHRWAIYDNRLCIVGESNGEEVYLAADLTLDSFIQLAEKLTNEEVFLLNAQIVLNRKLNRRPASS